MIYHYFYLREREHIKKLQIIYLSTWLTSNYKGWIAELQRQHFKDYVFECRSKDSSRTGVVKAARFEMS